MYGLILSTTFRETFLIPRMTERILIKDVYWYSCEIHVILIRY
jgi:hypothetical protein